MIINKKLLAMAIALLAVAYSAPRILADAQSDYDRNWSAREKKATTPGERTKLATELMDAADDLILGKKTKKDTLSKSQSAIEALRGAKRDEVMILCKKAYELGSKQREGYAPAARALGVIQLVDPAARLDSLVKLQKMYEDAYQTGSSKNVGIAKGFAAVLLQVSDEQWIQFQDRQAKGKAASSPPAEQIAGIRAINMNYVRGLEVIRSAISAIKPYAGGNKAYQDFLNEAGEMEKDLAEGQKKMSEPLARAAELDRSVKNQQAFQARLAGNPKDTAAADRLVRLYLNELDDPKALEGALKQASPAVQWAVALMKKPVSQLTASEALTVAQWCDKNNDNPASPNHMAMDIRTKVYCDAFGKAAKGGDPGIVPVAQIAKRIDADLAKSQIGDEQARKLTAGYVAALEPRHERSTAVAVGPAAKEIKETDITPEAPEKRDGGETPAVVKEKPGAVQETPAPEEPRELTSIKVEAPAKVKEEPESDAKRESRSSIFDFGRD
jgi:hypothetical protein